MWEEVRWFHQEGTCLDVRHVTAHLCQKERQEMSLFERFVAGGNEKTDALAKDEAMLDRGEMEQIRASTFQVRREEVCAAFAVRSQFSLLGWSCCWIVKNLRRRNKKIGSL